MKKEDLRPLEYKLNNEFNFFDEANKPKNTAKFEHPKGWFHSYVKHVSEDTNETLYAYIEDESGKMVKILADNIVKFTDR